MSESNSTSSGNHRKSFSERFDKSNLANQFAIGTSVLALILTGIQIRNADSDSKEQEKINSAAATFQAEVQSTADYQYAQAQSTAEYQYAQQFNIQETQIAMQSQMDAWARQQTIPFVKVIIPPEPVFIVEKITSEKTSSGYVINGSGFLDIVLSNDGGGRASLLNIDWVMDNSPIFNLAIRKIKFGDSQVSMPNTIEPQTPVKIQLNLEATVPDYDPAGKSDYQLGEIFRLQLLYYPFDHIAITFSNTTPINVQITDIQLAMPVVSFMPDPPSPFDVTNKTELGVACYSTTGQVINATVIRNDKEQAKITVYNNTCFSFPVDEYVIIDGATGNKVNFYVGANDNISVDLKNAPLPEPDAFAGEIMAWGILGIIVIASAIFLIKFRATPRYVKIWSTVRRSHQEGVFHFDNKVSLLWGKKFNVKISGEAFLEFHLWLSPINRYYLYHIRGIEPLYSNITPILGDYMQIKEDQIYRIGYDNRTDEIFFIWFGNHPLKTISSMSKYMTETDILPWIKVNEMMDEEIYEILMSNISTIMNADERTESSIKLLKQEWSHTREKFTRRVGVDEIKAYQSAREEAMSMTEEIVRMESEIDERVKTLYGIN